MKGQSRFSFVLYLAPDGAVHELTSRECRVARRVARWEMEMKPGGMIVLSTDVNAAVSKGSFLGMAKRFLNTWYNRLVKNKKVDAEMSKLVSEKGLETGWSIGNLFRGRYFSPKSKDVFNEKSMAIDVRGVDFDFVREAGIRLGLDFHQESVLLVDHSNGRTFLVGTAA